MAVMLVIDESGSMGWHKDPAMPKQATINLAEIFRN